MFSRGHHTAIFIVSMLMLLLLKDLLAKLVITCHDSKMLLMRFAFLSSSILFGATT
jgi:hypothetical protein